jgi:hypothetical protein
MITPQNIIITVLLSHVLFSKYTINTNIHSYQLSSPNIIDQVATLVAFRNYEFWVLFIIRMAIKQNLNDMYQTYYSYL